MATFSMSVTTTVASDPVKQFSVFAGNRVGRLHDLTALLRGNNVYIIALTVLDTTDSAIVRLSAEEPGRAGEVRLRESGV